MEINNKLNLQLSKHFLFVKGGVWFTVVRLISWDGNFSNLFNDFHLVIRHLLIVARVNTHLMDFSGKCVAVNVSSATNSRCEMVKSETVIPWLFSSCLQLSLSVTLNGIGFFFPTIHWINFFSKEAGNRNYEFSENKWLQSLKIHLSKGSYFSMTLCVAIATVAAEEKRKWFSQGVPLVLQSAFYRESYQPQWFLCYSATHVVY